RVAGAHLEDGDDIGAQVAVSAEWPWEAPVRLVSEALARGDRASAEWAWRNAWGAALGARRWEGMAAVGGLALRMGESPRAREAYLVALFRARDQRSFTGVLRAQEAVGTLGDPPVALPGLHIPGSMPGLRDGEAGIRGRRL